MRGRFSIEWMAQSSQPAGGGSGGGGGTVPAWGTHAESLPGFYCRPRNQEEQQSRSSQVSEAGFSSGTEEETSGYESEGGASLSPVAPGDGPAASPASPPTGRRPRTAFTAEQISSMERAFKRNAYLGTQDKTELCRKLNLSDKQIRNWFQNRRMKLKRTVQDALAASHILQAYRPAPYPHYHTAGGAGGGGGGGGGGAGGGAGGGGGGAAGGGGGAGMVDPAASFLQPQALPLGPPLPSGPSLPLDSLYPYSSLHPVVLPSYPPYPPYY